MCRWITQMHACVIDLSISLESFSDPSFTVSYVWDCLQLYIMSHFLFTSPIYILVWIKMYTYIYGSEQDSRGNTSIGNAKLLNVQYMHIDVVTTRSTTSYYYITSKKMCTSVNVGHSLHSEVCEYSHQSWQFDQICIFWRKATCSCCKYCAAWCVTYSFVFFLQEDCKCLPWHISYPAPWCLCDCCVFPVWSAHNSALRLNDSLASGDYLSSPDGKVKLLVGGDGNLKLVNQSATIWQSNTSSSGGAVLNLTGIGNLVLSQPNSSAVLWQSGTAKSAATQLIVRDDGTASLLDNSGTTYWNTGENESHLTDPTKPTNLYTMCARIFNI